jgi:FkbM family methyltransferase
MYFRQLIRDLATPTARAWIRYSPIRMGKDWLWQRFSGRPRSFTCRTRFDACVSGNTRDFIQRYIYYFGVWEPTVTKWIRARLKPGDGFVDVGANIGYYSLLASTIVGVDGCVVAVEAAPSIHEALLRQLRLNGCANVRPVLAAASFENGTVLLYPGTESNIGGTTMVPRDSASILVEAKPLHEILTEPDIRKARIIKIDVEGAELNVLLGLAPVLPRCRDDLEILIEISPALMSNPQEAETICAIMKAHGYSAFKLRNDYEAQTYIKGETGVPLPIAAKTITEQTDVIFSRHRYPAAGRGPGTE